MYKKLEKVCDTRCKLGEGPCWDEVNQIIYWIDIINKAVHSYNLKNNKSRTINLEKYVGSIGLRNNGDMIAALQDGFYFINNKTGISELIKEIEENSNIKRFNDGKVDGYGNYWAGTVSYDEKKPIGSLYCLKPDLQLKKFFNGITIANGITWSLDNKKMYYIDTPTMKVDLFDFDIENMVLTNRRIAFEIPEDVGYPDGMTIDMEGKLWIAHWGGYQVCRWDPDTKKILDKIVIPAERVSCCTFGGNDLSELFITTAQAGFTENIYKMHENDSGFLYKIQTNTKGIKSFRFGF